MIRNFSSIAIFLSVLSLVGLPYRSQAQNQPADSNVNNQVRGKEKVAPKETQTSLPNALNIVVARPKSRDSSLTLQQVKYSGPTVFGRQTSGTADLSITLAGHAFPVLKNQKFTGIVHDKFGKNTGIHISLGDDLIAKRFLGSKFDLTLEKGGEIVEIPAARGAAATHLFRGSVRIHLPYATQDSKPVAVHLGKDTGRKAVEIPLTAAGFTIEGQQIAIPPTTLIVDEFKFPGVKMLGTVKLDVNPQKTKPCSGETTLNNTPVIAYLPRFLLKQGFQAYAQQVSLDAGGDNSDDGIATFSAKTLTPPKLEFIRPAGFTLDCKGKGSQDPDKSISLKVVKGEYTDVSVEGKLILPNNFKEKPPPQPKTKDDGTKHQPGSDKSSESTPKTNDPVDSIIDAKLTYSSTQNRNGWSIKGSGSFAPTWNDGNFGLIVDSETKYTLQLDGPGGIKVTDGKFFSSAFKDSEDRPIELPFKPGNEFLLQSTGVTGQITVNPNELGKIVYPGAEEYQVVVSGPASTWRFIQSRLTAIQKYTGKLIVQNGLSDADLAVRITIGTDGKGTASVNGGTLSLPGYGLYFAIAQGVYKDTITNPKPGSPKKSVFFLSGTITFDIPSLPQLKSVAVPVTDVIFDHDGFFGDPYIETPPKSISIGQVDVDLKSFVFLINSFDLPSTKQLTKNVTDPHLNLNGQARLTQDFVVDYPHGLRISPTKNNSQRELMDNTRFIAVNDQGIDCIDIAEEERINEIHGHESMIPSAPDFGTISVKKDLGFAQLDFTLSKEEKDFGGKKVDCLFGEGTLLLGGSSGFNLTMFVANGSWMVFGSYMPPVAIPLGNSGLQIYAFRGGVGQNINVKPSVLSQGNAAGELKADDFVNAPGNFLFQAGVGIATKDDFLVWGDAMLTIITSPFSITVTVNANVFENHVKNQKPSGDRTATGSLAVTGSSLTAILTADLNFPSRKFPLKLASISGTSEFYIGSSKQYLHIGWPERNAGVSFFNGVLSLQGGLGIDVTEPSAGHFKVNLGTGFVWRENFLGIVKGQLDGNLYTAVEIGGDHSNLSLGGDVHVLAEVDFYVFSASVEAYLGGMLSTSPFELHIWGSLEGCIGTPFGDACASVGFNGTWH